MQVVLDIFEADRAWLLYPCDPSVEFMTVPIELTRPEYPGAMSTGSTVPMDSTAKDICNRVLATEDAVTFPDPNPLPAAPWVELFDIKAQMLVAIRPRVRKPWILGLHQCSHVREWTVAERRLFRDIAWRIRDAFSNLMVLGELRDIERRYRTVVNSVREVLFQLDAAGRIVFLNPAWEHLTGVSAAKVQGQVLVDQIAREHRAAATRCLNELLHGRAKKRTLAARLADHLAERWVDIHMSALRDDAEAPGIFGSIIDATDRIKADEEREDLIEREQAAIAEAKAAKELDRLKTNFLNAISHELRTPLTSILGFCEFLIDGLEGPLTPEQGVFAEGIAEATGRLQRLVNDLLDLARLESGTFSLEMEPADLVGKTREIVRIFGPQLREADVKVRVSGPKGAQILADSERIAQVLINFVSNAIKFSPRGGRIDIRYRREHAWLLCEVTDRGPGIATADIPRLFNRFSQLEAGSRKRGAGLGLSISKALVEAHGGAIGVKSELGEGSTFWFRLPVGLES